jgi:iron complex transport system permease protein
MMPATGHPTPPAPALTASTLSTGTVPSGPPTVACDRPVQGSILTPARWWRVMTLLSLVAGLSALVCLQLGTQYIGVGRILGLVSSPLFGRPGDEQMVDTAGVILFQVRLPRVVLGFLVGSCLASVGVALQALLRNPLADPYVLGVSSGAALGVAVAVLFGIGTTVLALSLLPVCGFVGGLVALAGNLSDGVDP